MIINFTHCDDQQRGFADTLIALEEKTKQNYEIGSPEISWDSLSQTEKYKLIEDSFARYIKSVEVVETGILAAYERIVQDLQEKNENLRNILVDVVTSLSTCIPEEKHIRPDQIALEVENDGESKT